MGKLVSERRRNNSPGERIELVRSADPSGLPKIVGYAAVFYNPNDPQGTTFELYDDVFETIMPTAFTRAIREDEVIGCFNHDESALLGRTKNGTCRLSVDSRGLKYEIDTPDTGLGRDLIKMIQRGDLAGSSFSFRPTKSTYREGKNPNDPIILERNEVQLVDVSPVTTPAYSGTTTSVRSGSQRDDSVPLDINRTSDELEYVEKVERLYKRIKHTGDRSLARMVKCHLSVLSRAPASRYGIIDFVRADGTRIRIDQIGPDGRAAEVLDTVSIDAVNSELAKMDKAIQTGPRCQAKVNQLRRVRQVARSMSPAQKTGLDVVKSDLGKINSAFSAVAKDIAALDKLAADDDLTDSTGGGSGTALKPNAYTGPNAGGRSAGKTTRLEDIQRVASAVRGLLLEAKAARQTAQLAAINTVVNASDQAGFLFPKKRLDDESDDYEFDYYDDDTDDDDDE